MNIQRKHSILSTAAIIFFLVMFSVVFITSASTIDYEETANTVLDSDEVITGIMDEFSKKMIIVDGIRYSLCKDVMAFNTAKMLIHLKNIEAAVEVKLFRNKGCVRKILVLKYAE